MDKTPKNLNEFINKFKLANEDKNLSDKMEKYKSSIESISQMRKDILDLTIATGLKIELAGHTDNTGSPAKNLVLSKQRALAVKKWLQEQSPADYPNNRFSKIEGFGSSKPVQQGTTTELS